jgi:hypothetical protein
MRFMMLVKASKESEAGEFPPREAFEAMERYNQELIKAGVLLAGEGLHPTSKGVRIRFAGKQGQPTVIDGPFAETKELLAGFWMIQVKSREEAIEWAKRVPFEEGDELEVRQVFDASDFPAEVFPPEAVERDQAMRREVERQAQR